MLQDWIKISIMVAFFIICIILYKTCYKKKEKKVSFKKYSDLYMYLGGEDKKKMNFNIKILT